MAKLLTALAFSALIISGCVSQDLRGGDPANWTVAAHGCTGEVRTFGLIPDFGITRDLKYAKCMQQRGWVQGSYGNQWTWTPGAVATTGKQDGEATLPDTK